MRQLLFFLFSCCLLACESESKVEAETPASAPETTSKPVRDEIVISLVDTSLSLFTNLFHDEFQDKPDMLFFGPEQQRWAITIPSKDSVKILGGDPMHSFFYELVLQRGDSLQIGIDSLQIRPDKTINYPIFTLLHAKTPWAELNFNYLLYKKNLDAKAFGFSTQSRAIGAERDSDQILQNGLLLLDSLSSQKQISNAFYHKTKRKLERSHAKEMIYAARNQKRELTIEDLNISLTEEKWAWDQDYLSFLRTVILYQYFKKERRVKNSKQFDFIANEASFLQPELRLAILDSYLKSIFFVEKSQFRPYLKKLRAIDTAQLYTPKWGSLIAEKTAKQDQTALAQEQTDLLTNLLGDPPQRLSDILAQERGKIVLVDFWASWCTPCRQEMPAVSKLQNEIGKDKLAVIQISIDKQTEAWERAAIMENIHEQKHNYLISAWESSDLYQRYQIKTIPRYILFDTSGKLLAEDAPRPSSSDLKDLINMHL